MVSFLKKLPTLEHAVPYCWAFRTNSGLPIDPKWTYFKISQQFLIQNLNLKGVNFMKKLPSTVFWAPYSGPF